MQSRRIYRIAVNVSQSYSTNKLLFNKEIINFFINYKEKEKMKEHVD